MGELLAEAMSRGKCHWEKIWAASASRLPASAGGCSSLDCRRLAARGTWDPAPVPPQGAVWGHTWDTADRLDWDSTAVLGQFFLFAMAFADCPDGKYHGTDKRASGIMMIIFYFVFFFFSVFFSYQCFNEKKKKRKTPSVSGTVTFLFFQVRHFFFVCFHGFCYDVILQF